MKSVDKAMPIEYPLQIFLMPLSLAKTLFPLISLKKKDSVLFSELTIK